MSTDLLISHKVMSLKVFLVIYIKLRNIKIIFVMISLKVVSLVFYFE